MNFKTIYTIITQPQSIYGHDGYTPEQIEIFDRNIDSIMRSTKYFYYCCSRNENTDSRVDVWATDLNIHVSHGICTEIEAQDKESNVCDLSVEFWELTASIDILDLYGDVTAIAKKYLACKIDGWFDNIFALKH